jgi:hypothetical protein
LRFSFSTNTPSFFGQKKAPNVIVPQSFVQEGPILVLDLGKLSFKSGLTGGEKERNKRLAQADSSALSEVGYEILAPFPFLFLTFSQVF